MGLYAVSIGKAAARELRKLPVAAQKSIIKCMEKLSADPRPHGVEKLSQDPRFWRVRDGDYRIIYWISDDKELAVVLIVRHRRDAYRNLDQLDARYLASALAPLLIQIPAQA